MYATTRLIYQIRWGCSLIHFYLLTLARRAHAPHLARGPLQTLARLDLARVDLLPGSLQTLARLDLVRGDLPQVDLARGPLHHLQTLSLVALTPGPLHHLKTLARGDLARHPRHHLQRLAVLIEPTSP